MATLDVKDAAGATQTIERPLAPGRAADASSRPVALSTEDVALITPWGFDSAVVPTVTAGGYSGGDIVGALLDFGNISRVVDEPVMITGAQVVSKAAVLPNWTLMLFNADPTGTTKTDNAAYSLAAADAFKLIKAIPITAITDHGTPNSWSIEGLGLVVKPVSGARNLYGLLIDAVGVTLTSTTDIQVRLRGVGV